MILKINYIFFVDFLKLLMKKKKKRTRVFSLVWI